MPRERKSHSAVSPIDLQAFTRDNVARLELK